MISNAAVSCFANPSRCSLCPVVSTITQWLGRPKLSHELHEVPVATVRRRDVPDTPVCLEKSDELEFPRFHLICATRCGAVTTLFDRRTVSISTVSSLASNIATCESGQAWRLQSTGTLGCYTRLNRVPSAEQRTLVPRAARERSAVCIRDEQCPVAANGG